jgi:hypothetical protein
MEKRSGHKPAEQWRCQAERLRDCARSADDALDRRQLLVLAEDCEECARVAQRSE